MRWLIESCGLRRVCVDRDTEVVIQNLRADKNTHAHSIIHLNLSNINKVVQGGPAKHLTPDTDLLSIRAINQYFES